MYAHCTWFLSQLDTSSLVAIRDATIHCEPTSAHIRNVSKRALTIAVAVTAAAAIVCTIQKPLGHLIRHFVVLLNGFLLSHSFVSSSLGMETEILCVLGVRVCG